MKKIWLLVPIIFFMLVPIARAQPLSDINGHWAEEYVRMLVNSSVISGFPDGSFRPQGYMTRQEFVKCLIYAKKIPVSASGLASYTDVPMTDWSYPYIETAVAAGILKPEESINGMLRPGEPIPRVEIARLIVRALKLPIQSSYTGYDDGINIPPAFRGYVCAVKAHNLMSGYPDGTFRPWNSVTRAEASTILVRLIYESGKGTGLVTICYDHNEASIYTNAFPLHRRYAYPGVNYILPSHIGGRGMLTLEQLKEMEAAGWETGSHSKNHIDFKGLSDREIRDQLALSQDWLRENGLQSSSFAYPFWFEGDPYPVVSEYYASAVTCFGKQINIPPLNPYKLERIMLDTGLTKREIEDFLEQAVVQGGWVIFYTHSVAQGNDAPSNHGINQQELEYLLQEINKRGLKVVTVSEGLALKGSSPAF